MTNTLTNLRHVCMLIFGIAIIAACSAQRPISNNVTAPDALADAKGYRIVATAENIQNFRINGFNTVNDRSLIINTDVNTRYLVTLRSICIGLRSAQNIATTSTNRRLTKFDSIIIRDGGAGPGRCPIDGIFKLEKLPPDAADS